MRRHEVTQAMSILKEAMEQDDDYAWGWHCNIAMTCFDAGASYKQSNEWAATFMKNCFNVDTSKLPYYKELSRDEE